MYIDQWSRIAGLDPLLEILEKIVCSPVLPRPTKFADVSIFYTLNIFNKRLQFGGMGEYMLC